MKENIEQDMDILYKIRGNKNQEQQEYEWDESDSDYIENFKNLTSIERVLRLNEWSEEAKQILEKKSMLFRIHISKVAIAAGLAFFLSLGYLVFDKNYGSDLIIYENTLRTKPEPTSSSGNTPEKQAYVDFLEGRSSYHAKEYDRAIIFYNKALKANQLRNQLREAIEWHLCVALLLQNEVEDCEKLLLKIESNPKPKYEINKIDFLKLKTQLWLKKQSNSFTKNP